MVKPDLFQIIINFFCNHYPFNKISRNPKMMYSRLSFLILILIIFFLLANFIKLLNFQILIHHHRCLSLKFIFLSDLFLI